MNHLQSSTQTKMLLFCSSVCLLICYIPASVGNTDGGGITDTHNPGSGLMPKDERFQIGAMLHELAEDIIKEQGWKAKLVETARYDNKLSPAFEVGYMTLTIQEHYRKMLSKWQSVKSTTIRKLYNMECVMYLEEVENLYWQIKHEVHMLHEVERKYKVKSAPDETYEDPFYYDEASTFPTIRDPNARPIKEIKSFNVKKFFKNGLIVTTRRPKGIFPKDYGWDIYEWNSDT